MKALKVLIAMWFSVGAFGTIAAQRPVAKVAFDQFQVGKYWVWTFSEWNSPTNSWKPYLNEKYKVVDIQDKKITIDMTSFGIGQSQKPSHHRMIVDFAKCERASRDANFKNFLVEFYSQNLVPGRWELVSKSHPNLVFIEKFNCSGPLPHNLVNYRADLFQVQSHRNQWSSWYYLNHPTLKAVAAEKLFSPDGAYRFHLSQTGTAQ